MNIQMSRLGEITLGNAVYVSDPAGILNEQKPFVLKNILPGRYVCRISHVRNDAFHKAALYTRVVSLEICHVDFFIPATEEMPISVEVDSGEAGFFDVGYIAGEQFTNSGQAVQDDWLNRIAQLKTKEVPNPDYLKEEAFLRQEMGARYRTEGEVSGGALPLDRAESVIKERLNLSYSYQERLAENPLLGRRTFVIGSGGTLDNACCVAQTGQGDGGYACFVGRCATGQIVSAKLVFMKEDPASLTFDHLERIGKCRRRCGEAEFRMALQFLMDTGKDNFTLENAAATKASILKNTPANAIMTADYQMELLDIAWALSKFPTWDVLLYVKLYLGIKGDDLPELEEAERSLSGWSDLMAPRSWKDAVAEPDLRGEILRRMVEGHQSAEYTRHEIEEAIRFVAEDD